MLTPAPVSQSPRCHVCSSAGVEFASGYAALRRVTSDCKPWPVGGTLACCGGCGTVQALVTEPWRAEAEAIYAGYTIYHQGGGAEQRVFGGREGIGQPRSERLLAGLRTAVPMGENGRLLDIGCGNGSFLAAWSRACPGWSLYGTEVSRRHEADLERIPGFAGLFTGDLAGIEGSFDVISLVHVLEHIPDPIAWLQRCRGKLKPQGLLVVQVPDCLRNPFMLLVADHCSHFSGGQLSAVVATAGFEIRVVTDTWVAKEISLVARPHTVAAEGQMVKGSKIDSAALFGGWRRLASIRDRGLLLARHRPFGLFGTAIAATWLDAELEGAVEFFVDEDPTRTGRTHLGRPILAPADLPPGAAVFVALPDPLAGQVAERLARLEKNLRIEHP